MKFCIPDCIESGDWNRSLGKIVKALQPNHTLEEVTKKIESIPGAKSGDRLDQAKRWYSYYSKNQSQPLEVSKLKIKKAV